MKQSRLLQVASVLMIIAAVAAIVIAVLAAIGLGSEFGQYGILAMALILFIPLILSVIQLIAGIVGFRNWANPQRAGSCLIWGFVYFILSLAINVYGFIASSTINYLSVGLGLLIPILYLIGAFILKSKK